MQNFTTWLFSATKKVLYKNIPHSHTCSHTRLWEGVTRRRSAATHIQGCLSRGETPFCVAERVGAFVGEKRHQPISGSVGVFSCKLYGYPAGWGVGCALAGITASVRSGARVMSGKLSASSGANLLRDSRHARSGPRSGLRRASAPSAARPASPRSHDAGKISAPRSASASSGASRAFAHFPASSSSGCARPSSATAACPPTSARNCAVAGKA